MWPLLWLLAAGPTAQAPHQVPIRQGLQVAIQQSAQPAQPVAPRPLTLADALQRARSRSPLRRSAEQRLQSAGSARSRVHRLPNPSLELRSENWGAGSAATNPRDNFAVVTQTFELGGKYAGRRREASAYENLARATASAADWELASEVVDRYVSALQARGTHAVLTEHQHSLEELTRVLAAQVEEGTTAEADWRRLEVEGTRVRFDVARAGIALERELALLSALVGERVEATQLVMPELPAAVEPRIVDVDQVSRRPDIRMARAEVDRLQAVTMVERAAGVPDLSVSAGYKGTDGLRTGVAALGFEVPLFQHNAAAVARAAGEAAAAEHQTTYLTERAVAEATAEWSAARKLAEEAARLDAALLTPAEVVRVAARSAYLEGGGDILRLVDAERGYAEAAADALNLRMDALRALTHARLAVGEEPLP